MLFRRAFVFGAMVLVACGDDGSGPSIDAPMVVIDMPSGACQDVVFDNGSCGDLVRFTGEYIDWYSQPSTFCGIFGAVFEVEGGGAMDSTAPNGRFDLCIPDAEMTRLDITHAAGNSACSTPASNYTVPVIAMASPAMLQCGGAFSGRAWTAAQQTEVFTAVGAPIDAARAHVFVHVDGQAREVVVAATHGPAQHLTATGWVAGATGTDVFFPNVDVGGGSTTVTVAGDAVGTGTIEVEAGTITNVSIKAL